jgi:hypothetical protein
MMPINIALQSIIEQKYPEQYRERNYAVKALLEAKQVSRDRVDNIPVLNGVGLHLLPNMNEILTVKGRSSLDLVHTVTQGNKRFVIF